MQLTVSISYLRLWFFYSHNDPFEESTVSPDRSQPLTRVWNIVPSDDDNLQVDGVEKTARAIYVGKSGDLALVPSGNDERDYIIFQNVPVGWFPVRTIRVRKTGTTARKLRGGY